jgi:hypothetical protein
VAFIAGYVAERPQSTEAIRARVLAYSILPGESESDYRQAIVPTRFGHLIVKHKASYPIKPQMVFDAEGNALVTLGFVLSGDAKALLPLALSTGARSLEECEGEFVAVCAEAASGAVHIVNDRFSSRPFYILRQDDGVYFSSNLAFLLTLARAPYRPDVVGWLEVCTSGHTIGARTTAKNVQRLRPATHLVVTPEKVSESQYWRLQHCPDPDLDPARHSAEVFEAFRASTERRSRLIGTGVVALSGGLDSRFVAGALPPHADYSAFTFVDIPGASSTPQTRAAAEVCSALGLRHHVEALAPRFTRAPEVIALTGGMRPYQHMAIVMVYLDHVRRQGHDFSLGGGPGDSLAGAFIPSRAYLDCRRTAESIEDACRRRLAGSPQWSLMFRDDVIEGSRRAVEDSLGESFAAMTGPTAAHRITAWAMVYRQPAFTFTSVLHTHPDVTEAFCHLDYRYTDLMLQLPASWLYQRRFYSYMMYAELPHLRHIRYTNTGRLISGEPPTHDVPVDSIGRRAVEFAQSFGTRAVRRIMPDRAGGASLVFRDSLLLDEVEECVHSIDSLRDLLDVERCDDLLARTRAGACPSEEALGALTSLCVSAATLRTWAFGLLAGMTA